MTVEMIQPDAYGRPVRRTTEDDGSVIYEALAPDGSMAIRIADARDEASAYGTLACLAPAEPIQ